MPNQGLHVLQGLEDPDLVPAERPVRGGRGRGGEGRWCRKSHPRARAPDVLFNTWTRRTGPSTETH